LCQLGGINVGGGGLCSPEHRKSGQTRSNAADVGSGLENGTYTLIDGTLTGFVPVPQLASGRRLRVQPGDDARLCRGWNPFAVLGVLPSRSAPAALLGVDVNANADLHHLALPSANTGVVRRYRRGLG
jgi:hypothetical protein